MMYPKICKRVLAAAVGIVFAAAAACAFWSLPAAGICLAAGAALLLLFVFFTKRRYAEIERLNTYLSQICAGIYDLKVQDNEEGELSILKNNLYKMMLLLRSQNEALQKDKLYLSASLADISHQLKTPLTSILMLCDLLQNEQDPALRQRFTGIIDAQAQKMNWLVVTLLKLSKLDAGTIVLQKADVSVNAVLDAALEPFLVTADLRSITLNRQGVLDFSFIGDKNWSAEAIGNIVKNCLEHMENGGTLTFSTERTAIYNALCIADDGCGIPEAELPHIFERFYHGENASADSVGIGLALCQTILRQENAQIEVHSTLGKGTTFTLKFYKTIV